MITYDVQVPQLTALSQAFQQAPARTTSEIIDATNASLVAYQATAKRLAPVRQGTLRGSIQIIPAKASGDLIEGSVGTTLNYAIFQEQGTGIYGPAHTPITPRSAKALVFTVDGKKVFAKSVQGFPGRFYMQGSLEHNQANTEANFQRALDNVANFIGGAS